MSIRKTIELITNSSGRYITPSGLSIVGNMLSRSEFVQYCNQRRDLPKRSEPQIPNGDIIYNPNFTQAKAQAIRKNIILDNERKALFEKLDVSHIWHMPLKGAILKELYPSYGVRQMADNDILYDSCRADDVKAIMEGLGFKTVSFGHGNHDVYHKPPVSSFEMHRNLFGAESDKRIVTYYRSIKDSLILFSI